MPTSIHWVILWYVWCFRWYIRETNKDLALLYTFDSSNDPSYIEQMSILIIENNYSLQTFSVTDLCFLEQYYACSDYHYHSPVSVDTDLEQHILSPTSI